MKIWDGFMYNGEVEALRARLAVPGIHKRVLVEALMTHSGREKPRLFYDQQLPGVVLVTPDLSGHASSWARENAQRNAIMEGLAGADPDDIVLIGDNDEIPSQDGIARASDALRTHPAVVLCQTMYNFDRTWVDPRGWRGTVVTTYGHLVSTTPQALRDAREELPRIPAAGEHLSWFGGPGEISRKLASFAHTEYASMAGDETEIRTRVQAGEDLFGRWRLQRAAPV